MATSVAASLRSDVEIVQRVLAHIDAGTTDEGEAWREPVEHYVDPVRFADELRLLRSGPSVFVPSACFPNAGDHVERVAFGVPLFAVRGTDGRARVFRNACRHRGVSLVQGTGAPAPWCARITAGPTASTAPSPTYRTPTASRTSTWRPAGSSRWPAARSTG